MVQNLFTRKRLSMVLLAFVGLQLMAPMAFAGARPPGLSTPTMSPSGSYVVKTDTDFSYVLSNLNSNANVSASIIDGNGNTMKTFSGTGVGSQPNGTHTITWNGTFDAGKGKPAYDATYSFRVSALYGTPPAVTALGPKDIQFTVASPQLTAVKVDSDPYNPSLDPQLAITTTVKNIYASDDVNFYADLYQVGQNNSFTTLYHEFNPIGNVSDLTLTWDGMLGGKKAPDGMYKAITYGIGTDWPSNNDPLPSVTFEVKNGALQFDPTFTTPSVSDNPFDIGVTNNTNVFKTTLQLAPQNDVTVSAAILQNNSPIYSWNDMANQGNGEKVFTWDGKDSNNQKVAPGNYHFEVWGYQGNTGLDPKQVNFVVIDSSQQNQSPVISGLTAQPSTFSPDNDNVNDASMISFDLLGSDAADITMTLGANAPYNANGVIYDSMANPGKISYKWQVNLPGSNKNYPDGTYPVKVEVSNQNGTDVKTINLVIDTTAGSVSDCGFSDVSKNDVKMCAAWKFAKDRGIFVGDAGKTTVRPNTVINRVEAGAVIERTFDSIVHYPSDNTNLGFVDVNLNAWYMADGTLRTAVKNGVLKGDATGNTMRPGDQVINAEFITMFVRAMQGFDQQYATLPTVNKAPYLDTTLAANTMWYVKPANALLQWFGLYTNKQYFNATAGRTRADVVLLIYDAYQAGLNI